MHTQPLDKEKDKRENLYSTFNIDRHAANLDNEQDMEDNNTSVIVISTPPNSPEPQNETVQDTATRT